MPTRLPSKPTPAQRRAAESFDLTPAEQAKRWSTHSGASRRLLETHARLDAMVRARFPDAQDTFAYNMRGWSIRRPTDITEWDGTIDPNWIRIFIAERKAGMSIHLWNPYEWQALDRAGLRDAGFKPMVGCLQFNRKGEVPLEALAPLLDEMRDAREAES